MPLLLTKLNMCHRSRSCDSSCKPSHCDGASKMYTGFKGSMWSWLVKDKLEKPEDSKQSTGLEAFTVGHHLRFLQQTSE